MESNPQISELKAKFLAEAQGKLATLRKAKAPQQAVSTKLMQRFAALNPNDISLANLQEHLAVAMLLELATIPTYLAASWSIKTAGTVSSGIITSVVIEEMLHLTLACNVLNAVGGTPDFPGLAQTLTYPTQLPGSSRDFPINLAPFSPEQILTFLQIELPTPPGAPPAELNNYETIGQMYNGIIVLMTALANQSPPGVTFDNNPSWQVDPISLQFTAGAIVTDLQSAINALNIIIDQGEGTEDDIWEDTDGTPTLCHFYRFAEIYFGQYYLTTQTQPYELPQGDKFTVDWTDVYPMYPNVKTAQMSSSEQATSNAFNGMYIKMMNLLQSGFTGTQSDINSAIGMMFGLGSKATTLLQSPLPNNPGYNAGPTFEV
jgi:hypothetical protein